MRTAPVVAATLAFDAEGVAHSPLYGDRYHPRSGALEQARQVFLNGNGLPERWRGRERFVVLETGFGLGNNFLATWNAWRGDARRGARLHYVAIEKHPLARADFARVHAASPLAALGAELLAAWPPLTPDLHRITLDAGRVQLLLAFGDLGDWLPEIVAEVDAFYLDGFAPDRNPAMWQPRVFRALARIAAPEATAATWSVARVVQDGLAAAGFEVRRSPGSGGKREITLARFAPRFTPRRAPARLRAAAGERSALVVGAGLAGCAAAWALAEQGWLSTVVDARPAIAGGASGNRAGVFHGVVHPQDGVHARFNRAASLQARHAVRRAIDQHGAAGQLGGVLRLEPTASLAAMQARLELLGLPPDYVQALPAAAAAQCCSLPLALPAWFYPGGGWVDPAALAASLLARAGDAAAFRGGIEVAALRRAGERWQALDAAGRVCAEAAVVVLANGIDAARLLPAQRWPLHAVRGQTTELPAATPGLQLPSLPLTGNGYVLPELPGGVALFGATTQRGDGEAGLRRDDQVSNLARLARLTGSAPAGADLALAGRVGWRCVAEDRLPLIGAAPDVARLQQSGTRLDQPRFVPRDAGLYVLAGLASRGITWAALGAQALAALVSGAPCPLEASLLDGVDAARFASRAARRRPAAG